MRVLLFASFFTLAPALSPGQAVVEGWVLEGSFGSGRKPVQERSAVGKDYVNRVGALPHLAMGGAWKTILVATNVSSKPAKANIEVVDPSGRFMTVSLRRADTGQLIQGSKFTITLAEGGTVSLIAEGGAETKTGWVWYETVPESKDPAYGGIIAIHEVFRASLQGRPDLEAVVLPDNALEKKFIAPFDNTGGFRTAIALANTDTLEPISMTITIRDESGALLATRTDLLDVGRQRAFQTDEVWPETRDRRGTVVISANFRGLASLTLIFNPSGAMTTSQFYGISELPGN